MSGLKALLGDSVLNGKNELISVDSLSGKVVGLYFSAHWCPPCRGFTPQLAKTYKEFQASGKNFEIVFVSSDRDEASFKEYFGEMPWLALPFADRDRKGKLSRKFGVSGIPSLIILDSDGNTLNKDGRTAVSEDPEGKNFPWKEKTFQEVIQSVQFVSKSGAKKSFQDLQNENVAIGLYFSAHWCPPCRGFTPQLVKTYNEMKANGQKFEIVFVSSDRDEESFNEYFGEMPWLNLPFADREAKTHLSAFFGVEGIPTLVILDAKTSKVITTEGRSAVESDPQGKDFPWFRKSLAPLDASVGFVNDVPSFILMVENVGSAESEAAIKALEPVAKEYNDKFIQQGIDDKEMPIMFMYADASSQLGPRVRSLTNAPSDCTLILLNIPAEKKICFF